MSEFRLSPSQINTFLDEPLIWVHQKMFGIYGKPGPAAWTGTAVERGLEAILSRGVSQEEALEIARAAFDAEEAETDQFFPELPDERSRIPSLLTQAQSEVLQHDGLRGYQVPLYGTIQGVAISGKADFDFTEFYLDTKTTKRVPSSQKHLSHDHVRQMWIYRELSGLEQKIAYIGDKKSATYSPSREQYAMAEREVKGAIRAMRALYLLGPELALEVCCPRELDGFRWTQKNLDATRTLCHYPAHDYQP